jgi:hypothetical protein
MKEIGCPVAFVHCTDWPVPPGWDGAPCVVAAGRTDAHIAPTAATAATARRSKE